ncbi:conjugative transposon protein TraN [Flavisolibacter nicotianae]|uniref:conjugative transposon protein TraN n=1 Tax=Flavisolibacter nicotianae TaxID=2364882 RepID=UPI000EB22FDB|nr:conjugative transposon protein TraN [Flavisolibacter nicotianae]
MNRYLCAFALLLVCMAIKSNAQTIRPFASSAILQPYSLEVGYNKTTHLIFPFSIVSIDRGSAAILAQKAVGVENILRVKADQKAFEETNMSVITSDGKLYSFLVCYNPNPAYVSVDLGSVSEKSQTYVHKHNGSGTLNDGSLAHYAKLSLSADKNLYLSTKSAGISMSVVGVFIKENVMFLRFCFQNRSNINYDTDQFRLYVRDKARSKRTAVQEREIVPLLTEGEKTFVKADSVQRVVIAIPKLTIPEGKYLMIEMTEAAGSRNLLLKLKGKHLLKAKPLD